MMELEPKGTRKADPFSSLMGASAAFKQNVLWKKQQIKTYIAISLNGAHLRYEG